jgi:hypothetical protein
MIDGISLPLDAVMVELIGFLFSLAIVKLLG